MLDPISIAGTIGSWIGGMASTAIGHVVAKILRKLYGEATPTSILTKDVRDLGTLAHDLQYEVRAHREEVKALAKEVKNLQWETSALTSVVGDLVAAVDRLADQGRNKPSVRETHW